MAWHSRRSGRKCGLDVLVHGVRQGLDSVEGGGAMKRVVQLVALTGLVAVVGGWLAGTPAVAATPPQVFHTQVDVSLPGIDVCGFTVDSVVKGTNTFEVFFDKSGNPSTFQSVSHVVSTLTNKANGKVVNVGASGRDNFDAAPVINSDGTMTVTDTLTGIPLRIYTSHRSTLVEDVGFNSFVDTFDSEGNFLSEQVIVHGPHGFLGDQTVFCNAITSAIG
jgi:hypothetical protein